MAFFSSDDKVPRIHAPIFLFWCGRIKWHKLQCEAIERNRGEPRSGNEDRRLNSCNFSRRDDKYLNDLHSIRPYKLLQSSLFVPEKPRFGAGRILWKIIFLSRAVQEASNFRISHKLGLDHRRENWNMRAFACEHKERRTSVARFRSYKLFWYFNYVIWAPLV